MWVMYEKEWDNSIFANKELTRALKHEVVYLWFKRFNTDMRAKPTIDIQ